METSNKKLDNLLYDIHMLYNESKKVDKSTVSIEKNLQTYETCKLYVDEAVKQLDIMSSTLQNIQPLSLDTVQLSKIDDYVEMLNNCTNFDTVLKIYDILLNAKATLPVKVEIIDNVENEIIFEDCEM